jgi:hypothetical protein
MGTSEVLNMTGRGKLAFFSLQPTMIATFKRFCSLDGDVAWVGSGSDPASHMQTECGNATS